MRYSDDQPRQDDGKFGSGGGNSSNDNDNKDKKKDKKDLHKKPKGASLTKKQFAQAASDAMSDFTSKSPKGFAQDFDNEYGYTANENNVIDFTYSRKIKSKDKGNKTKWQKKKKK
jgi:hypothetical protein